MDFFPSFYISHIYLYFPSLCISHIYLICFSGLDWHLFIYCHIRLFSLCIFFSWFSAFMWAYIVWFELKLKCFEQRISSHLRFIYCLELYLPWAHENYLHVNLHVAFEFGSKLDQLGNNFWKKIICISFFRATKIIYSSPVNIFLETVQIWLFSFDTSLCFFFLIFYLWQISSALSSFQIHCSDWPFIWKINLKLPYVLSELNWVLFFTASKFLQESVSLNS